jgi:hypothetical protein
LSIIAVGAMLQRTGYHRLNVTLCRIEMGGMGRIWVRGRELKPGRAIGTQNEARK